tara:strand:+ start:1697 stop:1939 length:243 start_codon:yes stop_codon:yes gene_type:complete
LLYFCLLGKQSKYIVIVQPSSGPTLLQINHETREELVKHYSCPFSLEIGGVESLMIDWRFGKLFMNTKHQTQIYNFEPGL